MWIVTAKSREMTGGTRMSLASVRNRSGRRITEYQEASCSTGWIDETSTWGCFGHCMGRNGEFCVATGNERRPTVARRYVKGKQKYYCDFCHAEAFKTSRMKHCEYAIVEWKVKALPATPPGFSEFPPCARRPGSNSWPSCRAVTSETAELWSRR